MTVADSRHNTIKRVYENGYQSRVNCFLYKCHSLFLIIYHKYIASWILFIYLLNKDRHNIAHISLNIYKIVFLIEFGVWPDLCDCCGCGARTWIPAIHNGVFCIRALYYKQFVSYSINIIALISRSFSSILSNIIIEFIFSWRMFI